MREEDVERVHNLMSKINQREEEELKKLSEPSGSGEHADLITGIQKTMKRLDNLRAREFGEPCPEFSEEEERSLDDFGEKLNAKLCEIVQHLASEFGHGGISDLDDSALRELVETAKEAIENWWFEGEDQKPVVEPKTPLQKLLAEHLELSLRITFIGDEALERDMRAYPEKYPTLDDGETE